MSDERILTVVKRSFEALNARDLDGVFECFTDDCVFDGSRIAEGVYRGKEAYREFLEGVLESLGELQHEEVTYLTEGERVIALADVAAAGSRSGASAARRLAYLYELRDGLIARQEIHSDVEALLRELGIDE